MSESLNSGGKSLFEYLCAPTDSVEMTALITEVCRIKDRLDRLHAVLTGDVEVWMRLTEVHGDSSVLEIRLDSAAVEARQLATVFRQMLAEVKRRRDEADDGDEDDPLADL